MIKTRDPVARDAWPARGAKSSSIAVRWRQIAMGKLSEADYSVDRRSRWRCTHLKSVEFQLPLSEDGDRCTTPFQLHSMPVVTYGSSTLEEKRPCPELRSS
jgi:hypothetical protein